MSSLHNVFCSSAMELTEIRTKYVHGNRLAALMHAHRLWYSWSSKLNTKVHSNNSLDSLINVNLTTVTALHHYFTVQSTHPRLWCCLSHIPSLPVVSDGLPCCLQGTHMTVTGNVSQHMLAWVCHQMLQQVRVSVNKTTRWGCCHHALQQVTDATCHNTKCESVIRCSNKNRVLDGTRKFQCHTCHGERVQAHFRKEVVFALTSAMLSAHAILMCSTVAGLSKGKSVVAPQSLLQTVTSHCVM